MNERSAEYSKGSLSLLGTIAMGTGVMIGAGIFALTGQVAELAGGLFPIAFIVAAVISGFSAYSYIKVASAYPSAGGIAMILKKAYGETTVTGAAALLMALSMIINESLVARTFGTYTLQLFPSDPAGIWVPVLAVGLIVAAFLVNLAGNKVIGTVSKVSAVVKIKRGFDSGKLRLNSGPRGTNEAACQRLERSGYHATLGRGQGSLTSRARRWLRET